jgi:hypothetical protein
MTLFYPTNAWELVAPALYRRAHVTAQFVARQSARPQPTGTRRRRPFIASRTLVQGLRVARNVLYSLWGIAALASWLVLAVGFLR